MLAGPVTRALARLNDTVRGALRCRPHSSSLPRHGCQGWIQQPCASSQRSHPCGDREAVPIASEFRGWSETLTKSGINRSLAKDQEIAEQKARFTAFALVDALTRIAGRESGSKPTDRRQAWSAKNNSSSGCVSPALSIVIVANIVGISIPR